MGRKSTKENKNLFFLTREECGWTREQAVEHIPGISIQRLERIENQGFVPTPEEVLVMEEGYGKPSLKNHYCSNVCAIGKKYVPEIKSSGLESIVLQIVNSLNEVEEEKNKLIKISADGEITSNEIKALIEIQDKLERISINVDSLKLWVEKRIADGDISKAEYIKIKKEIK